MAPSALITGASTGIGRATTLRLARAGRAPATSSGATARGMALAHSLLPTGAFDRVLRRALGI